jgi:hypothetical protein
MRKEANAGFGPIPHYPNWVYYCPTCKRIWELDVKLSPNYVTKCFDCVRQEHLKVPTK